MKWTNEPQIKSGWCWWKKSVRAAPEIVRVYPTGAYYRIATFVHKFVNEHTRYKPKWGKRIPEPKE